MPALPGGKEPRVASALAWLLRTTAGRVLTVITQPAATPSSPPETHHQQYDRAYRPARYASARRRPHDTPAKDELRERDRAIVGHPLC
jgi:hypothetical protein